MSFPLIIFLGSMIVLLLKIFYFCREGMLIFPPNVAEHSEEKYEGHWDCGKMAGFGKMRLVIRQHRYSSVFPDSFFLSSIPGLCPPGARFSKVPILFGPFSGVTISSVSHKRRGFKSSNFTVSLLFNTLKSC